MRVSVFNGYAVMKRNRFYKWEMMLFEKAGGIIDRIPDGIVYTSIAVLAIIAVVLSL